MEQITRKSEIGELLPKVLEKYSTINHNAFIEKLDEVFLTKKIKFPLLEYIGIEIAKVVPYENQIELMDDIMQLDREGGNVLVGIICQLRLEADFEEAFLLAKKYIIKGDKWYVCDIIGERVLGFGLLTNPNKAWPVLNNFAKHENKWVVRSVGVGIHYAVKKGLSIEHTERCFRLLVSLSKTTDFHTKKGIGWAAKTVAKFHPDFIMNRLEEIQNNSQIRQWFKTKLKIGLGNT
ncbi:DNA alkylation repair protein [Flexithrix dorotheae]|uniref:DNA alkylation repair protein n=1 Tax=Flexithrix dorotheae TaxID=70993 RepID=UPI000363097B|nr:DNA alkylation repair protein [Flexithrix dorotheae]